MRLVIVGSLNLKARRRRSSSSSYLQSASLLWAVWALRLGTRGDRLAHWSAQSPRSRPLPGCQEPTRRATVSPKKVTSLSHPSLYLNKFSQIFHKFLATISAQTAYIPFRGHFLAEEIYFWRLIYFWRASTSQLFVSWSSSLWFVCCPARVDKKGWNVARSSQRDRSAFRWAGTEVFAPLLYLQAAHMCGLFQLYAQGNLFAIIALSWKWTSFLIG